MPQPERPRPFFPVLAAWLVPGAGHLWLRRPWPALFVAGAVIPLFVFGMALAGWENVSPERHQWFFALHAGCGLPTLVATLLTRGHELTEYMPHYKTGELYTAVAGLLNVVAVADCWARCKRGDPEEMAKRAKEQEQAVRALRPEDLVRQEPAENGRVPDA